MLTIDNPHQPQYTRMSYDSQSMPINTLIQLGEP